jgi:hypothetical protein
LANILLIGAGFSRNWGGWLANEAFEYLLGVDGLHPRVRRMLWDHKERKTGFEGVYTALKGAATNPTDIEVFRSFDAAVAGMFHVMRGGFERASIDLPMLRFLASFASIFTLNQDTFLELKYLSLSGEDIRSASNGVFFGIETPGLRSASDQEFMPPGFYTPSDGPVILRDRFQPYFKLHGSSNWAAPENGKLMLIMGGGKDVEIRKSALLAWYFEEFEKRIRGNQVVIVGYSFNDEHINKILVAAARTGTRYFIVDPQGADVIDKRDGQAVITQPRTAFMDTMIESIDGASRRDLRNTLAFDHIERTKLDHFMTAGDRQKP